MPKITNELDGRNVADIVHSILSITEEINDLAQGLIDNRIDPNVAYWNLVSPSHLLYKIRKEVKRISDGSRGLRVNHAKCTLSVITLSL